MSRKYMCNNFKIIPLAAYYLISTIYYFFKPSVPFLAMLIGIYAYSIFLLGVAGYLFILPISVVTILFVAITLYTLMKYATWSTIDFLSYDKLYLSVFILLLILALINVIGALGPEYSFDALWYHLTLPKLFLNNHAIFHISGGLLYYSDMPKLGEMLFISALALHSEIAAKIIHYVFGILICIQLYQFARTFYSKIISLLVVAVFYANIVVSWESTVAYIDLIRTFYEFLSVTLFMFWITNKKISYLSISAVCLGFAITTKLLALGSLAVLSVLAFYLLKSQHYSWKEITKQIGIFVGIALLIPFPWVIFSYMNTGNPVYPFFTPLYPTHSSLLLLNPVLFVQDFFHLFTNAADPVSPLYLIFLPLLIFFPRFRKEIKILSLYALGMCVMWYITPRTGGGRFILPYLPVFSLLIGEILFLFSKQKKYNTYMLLSVTTIIVILFSTIMYRGVTNSKYIPYVLGKESKQEFLVTHLNFSFGDFIDIDDGIAKKIGPSDVVLLVGFHNVYYVSFPFIDISYIQNNDRFTYIATQHTTLPKQYMHAQKVYSEPITGTILYKVGEQRWNVK